MEKAETKAVKLGERKYVAFDNAKNEIIAFTRRRKSELKRRIAEARITVRGHTMGFNTGANR